MRAGRRTGILLVVALLMSALVASPARAAGWDEVDFEGSGWGHGVGMSQYGAQALATLGYDYRQILSHYFRGTSLTTLTEENALWVNLERNFSAKSLFVKNVGGATGGEVQISGGNQTVTASAGAILDISQVGTSGCKVEVRNPAPVAVVETPSACTIDFSWYDWDVLSAEPTALIEIAGCTLPDWNAGGGTVWRPCQYARGMLHLRYGTGGLDLSAKMLIDDYVMGISEVPPTWPEEALKAQVVAARTYAEARKLIRGHPANNSCDGWCHVRDTTADQRYVGWGHSNVVPWVTATASTARQVVRHPDSSIGVITTFYSSSTGGATEFGHEVGFSNGPVEWLSSVDDHWAVDGTVWNPNASWNVVVDESIVASKVGMDYLTSVRATQRRPGSGSVAEVEFWGVKGGSSVTATRSGSWIRQTFGLKSEYFDVDFRTPGDEMFFYRGTGSFAYYDVNPDGVLSAPILSGTGYSKGWTSITAVDLDGDSADEMFFYRASDGEFRYYNLNQNGMLGTPILSGSGYSKGWSSITAVDLDGDGQDEMFFYRESDGAYRYYNILANGSLGSPIRGGLGYSKGWSSITAVDLDGDRQDEMFFYRVDGTFRYYDIRPNGSLGTTIKSATYATNWSSITAVDLDGIGN